MAANTYNAHHEEMVEAFDLVADPEDWKAPVDGLVTAANLDDVVNAVSYFTACVARVELVSPGQFHVTAVGYRAGPAGDR